MGSRFVITEEEKINILGLYEQAQNKQTESVATSINENSVNVGYLVELEQSGAKSGSISPEEMSSIRVARIYFENLRDGLKPTQLTPGGKVVVDYTINQTKDLSYEGKSRLEKVGMNIKST